MLANETGGIAFFPKNLSQVDEIAAEVARDIREQYTIGYHSGKPMTQGGFRAVHVDAKAKGYGKLSVGPSLATTPTASGLAWRLPERVPPGFQLRFFQALCRQGTATLVSWPMTLSTREVAARALHIAEDVTELMGSTPMLHLHRVVPPGAADIYVKLEFFNPGGSVKDRAALGMILDAERRGLLQPGATILEATAGNTGVGLALVGVHRGYKVVLFVPEGFAEEKCILMRGFGATVIRTPRPRP